MPLKRSKKEILDRAYLNMILSDRGWQELPNVTGDLLSEREKMRSILIDVYNARGLAEVASAREREFLSAPIYSVVEFAKETIWYVEANPVLLWVIGFDEFPLYDGQCAEDYHPFFAQHKYRTPESTLTLPSTAPGDDDIYQMREVAMLWHWRTIEGINNQWIRNNGVVKGILEAFGEECERYLQQIPLIETPYLDFSVNGQHFNAISPQTLFCILGQARERQRALEWVFGGETWENTTVDT